MWPFPHLKLRLKIEPGDDFMGFRTSAVAASLFDDATRRDFMTKMQTHKGWSSLRKLICSVGLDSFLLAWILIEKEVEPRDSDSGRFGILSFLLAIFADPLGEQSCLEHFCPAPPPDLPYGWPNYYFWEQQRREHKRWLEQSEGNWQNDRRNPCAPRIGAFVGCRATIARLTRAAKKEYLWPSQSVQLTVNSSIPQLHFF
jgi:hypothetical protein